jgi:hypothetical protein
MRLRCLLVALTLVAAFASDSWGQSQRQPPRQDTKGTQQNSSADNRGTEQTPLIVKILPTEQTNEKAEAAKAEGPKNRIDGWSLSDKIAVIASVVAFLQFIALVATVGVMRRTGKRQLRAYISDIDGTAVAGDRAEIAIEIVFRNAGQTPAYDVEIWCEPPIIGRIDARPFDQKPRFAPVKTIIAPDSKFVVRRAVSFTDDANVIQAIQNSERAIFVWGRVNYVDAFEEKRHFIFRCVAFGHGSSWHLLPHPDGYEAN